jgi:transcriptional regulator with XRE-family HTH domain
MTEKQTNKKSQNLTDKWSHIKRQLKQRQLLFYKTEIPIDLINDYLHKTPSDEEILRIESVVLKDRAEKTVRIRTAIQKYVGHLKSPQLGRNIGVSDTTIREIWTGKQPTATYDIIDKLELYLNQNYDFELSVENTLTAREFLDDEVDIIIKDIYSISKSLQEVPKKIKKVVEEGQYDYQVLNNFSRYYFPTPIDNLNRLKEDLDSVTVKLQSIFDSFIKTKE